MEFKLSAVQRQTAPANWIAVELYGPGLANEHLAVEPLAVEKILAQATPSTLIDLMVADGAVRPVLVRERQYDPVKHRLTHLDLLAVAADKKVSAPVEIHPVGKAPAVINLGGILVKNIDHINLECLPADLPPFLEVDISHLAELGEVVRVEDLKLSDKIIVKNQARDPLFSILAPRKIVVETPTVEAAAPAEGGAVAGEVEEKKEEAGKKEGMEEKK